MADGTSHSGAVHTNNSQSSKYSAPCRAGAGGKAIAMRTISRPKIIGAISPPPYAQSSPPKPDAEASQSPPAAHRDDSLATNPSAGLVTEDHPSKRRRGGWGLAGVFAVVAWLAWLACPTAAFALTNTISISSVAGDNVVTASEKWNGFKITGHTGNQSNIPVVVTFGTETWNTTSTTLIDGNYWWSVSVPGKSSYITDGDNQTVNAEATFSGGIKLSHSRTFNVDLTLPLVVDAVTGDNTINQSEHTNNFAVTGNTGTDSGVTVTVTIGGTALTSVTSAIAVGATEATWSVTVPANANYITETSVDLMVMATKTGSVSATVTRTLSVDLTAPTVSYNTTPSSLKVGVAIPAMAPTTSDTDIASYGVHDDDSLPPGLAIDESTGVINGAPTTANNSTREVRVLATDYARNETTETITFPKVDMGDQTLVGFAYGAARIRYGDTAPRVTEPTGARTPVTYSAVPATVCTVNSLGALTIRAGGTCTITASADGDANYNAAADVTLGLEVARVTVDPPPESLPPEGLPVPEGGSAGYTVVLDTQPTHDVTINVNSQPGGDTDLTASPVGLTFTDSNWNTPQTVTLSAAEDDDGARSIVNFGHNAVSADSIYGGIGVPAVKAVEDDNDPIGVTIWPQVLRMPDGGSRKYTVVLNTQPTDDVTITVTRDHGGDDDLTADPDTLIFTEATWYTPQTVTVSAAKDDDQVNGVAIFSHSVASNDENYQSDDEITIAPVWVTEDETRPRVAIQTEAAPSR